MMSEPTSGQTPEPCGECGGTGLTTVISQEPPDIDERECRSCKPGRAHFRECATDGCTTDCPPYVEPSVVAWACPHDPTGTSPYACACEDG
jgi:hypothetical protein